MTAAANAHSWTTPSELTLRSLESRCDAALEGKDLSQPRKVLREIDASFLLSGSSHSRSAFSSQNREKSPSNLLPSQSLASGKIFSSSLH